jgi:hypothetical protein
MLYLIEAIGMNAVKNGVTANIDNRMRTLATSNHSELQLVGVCNYPEHEREFHRVLKPWRLRGEWFTWNDDSRALFNATCVSLGIEFKPLTQLVAENIWANSVIGPLVADAVYSNHWLVNSFGRDGADEIMAVVKPFGQLGKHKWYRGSDLIALIFSEQQKQRRAS